MSKKSENNVDKGIVIVIVAMLIIAGAFMSYLILSEEDEIEDKEIDIFEIDDRISPYTNQGLMVEILNIRNRGLLDKMMTRGLSWRETPSFYYIINVDGQEGNSKGNVGPQGVYMGWDTLGQESHMSFYIEEEQETSDVEIIIMEQVKSGLLKRKTTDVEKEKISVVYDYRTGRWESADDSFKDFNGIGHYLGENYEIWFNIYQMDYDHDGIPFWTEVNVLGTNPTVDDREMDPDNDDIPTSWEWKWGYDPFTWNDHKHLDPEVDGIENIEEYQLRKWLSNPYQPDIYIETDKMEKGSIISLPLVLYEEAQQMVIERLSQHGINVYIDDGWPDGPSNGGGELLPFYKNVDDHVGKQLLSFYKHNFADERKGIFRYIVTGLRYAGFTTPNSYNVFDAIFLGNNIYDALFIKKAYTPRMVRYTYACVFLHELGHTFGFTPPYHPGVDIMGPPPIKYPNMPVEEYENYRNDYYGVMNYKHIYDKTLFDFSDGSNGAPYDINDWEHLYLPTFQIDDIRYEEPRDESFEDYEIENAYPGVTAESWEFNEDLTEKFSNELKSLSHLKNTDSDISIFVKANTENENDYNIRVYAMPNVYPVHAVHSLIAEGHLESDGNIKIYSQQDLILSIFEELM